MYEVSFTSVLHTAFQWRRGGWEKTHNTQKPLLRKPGSLSKPTNKKVKPFECKKKKIKKIQG